MFAKASASERRGGPVLVQVRFPRLADPVISVRGLRKSYGRHEADVDDTITLVGDPDLVFLDEPTTGFDLLVGTATMCTLGIALTRITTTADSASAIGPFATVILAFVSGVFIPVADLPTWLADIGRIFPLAHLAEGLQRTYSATTAGDAIDGSNLAVLALWGIGALAVAIRTFRWEPQGTGGG